jgi:hypothetical protein
MSTGAPWAKLRRNTAGMDFKRISQRARRLLDKRGGTDSLKQDAAELRDIARGPGSVSDKAKAAAGALKEPGARKEPDAPQEPAAAQPEPGAGQPPAPAQPEPPVSPEPPAAPEPPRQTP